MGYSLDLFTSPNLIHAEFICSVCQDVMKLPTMSENCEHIYCSSCITQWKISSLSNTCPIDRSPISGLRTPIRAYMNMYNELQLKCGHEGCPIVTNVEEIVSHHKTCEFNPEAIRACVRNCGASIKMKDLPAHDCIEFLKGECGKKDKRIEDMLKLMTTKDETYGNQIDELRRETAKKDLEIYQLKLRTMVKGGSKTGAGNKRIKFEAESDDDDDDFYGADDTQVPHRLIRFIDN